MWRLKYLVIGMIPSAVLGVGLYFLAPEMADALRDSVRKSASHAVEREFVRAVPATVKPGQIEITERQIEQAIENADATSGGWNIDGGVAVQIEDGRISILIDDSDRSADNATIASGEPVIEGGEFRLINRRGILSIFKPARDAIGDEIEKQVATLFANSKVRPVSVTAINGRLVIVTESLSSVTATPTKTDPAQTPTPTPQVTRTGGLSGTPLRTPTPTP